VTSPPDEELAESIESDYDFTAEPAVPSPASPSIGDKVTLGREYVRGWLAGGLVALLVGLEIALLLVAVLQVRPFDRDTFALLLTGLLNPVVTLVGAVLGFYFGEKAGKGTGS
jgi:hypothetical protein